MLDEALKGNQNVLGQAVMGGRPDVSKLRRREFKNCGAFKIVSS